MNSPNKHYRSPYLRRGFRGVPPGQNAPTPLAERIGCGIGCLLITALFIFMFVNVIWHFGQTFYP